MNPTPYTWTGELLAERNRQIRALKIEAQNLKNEIEAQNLKNESDTLRARLAASPLPHTIAGQISGQISGQSHGQISGQNAGQIAGQNAGGDSGQIWEGGGGAGDGAHRLGEGSASSLFEGTNFGRQLNRLHFNAMIGMIFALNATQWSMTFSSKVNLHLAINVRA